MNPELVSPIVEDRYRPCSGGRAGIYCADQVIQEANGSDAAVVEGDDAANSDFCLGKVFGLKIL